MMDILVNLVEALAWPVTVLALGLLFRSELRGVIARLSHVKYKEWEARFEKELRQAEDQVRQIPTVSAEPQRQLPEPKEYERLLRLAEVSPRAAVMEAWREVELATSRASRAAEVAVEGRIAGTRHLHKLVQRNLVPGTLVSVYGQLRRLRNQAAHGAEFSIDETEAERYVELALTIVRALDRVDGAA